MLRGPNISADQPIVYFGGEAHQVWDSFSYIHEEAPKQREMTPIWGGEIIS